MMKLKNYENASFEVTKKAPYLIMVYVMLFISNIFTSIGLINSKNTIGIILVSILAVIYLFSFNWVYNGKYNRGTIGLYAISTIIVIIFATNPYSSPANFGQTTLFFIILHLLLNFFLSARKSIRISNLLLISAYFPIIIHFYFVSKTSNFPILKISDFINPIIIYICAVTVFIWQSSLLSNLISYSNDEIKKSFDREKKTMLLVKASTEQFNQTSLLLKSADETSSAAIEIEGSILSIKHQIETLNQQIIESKNILSILENKLTLLDETSNNQSTNTIESSSAIEEISASINSVATIIQNKSGSFDALKKTSQKGSDIIQETTDLFNVL